MIFNHTYKNWDELLYSSKEDPAIFFTAAQKVIDMEYQIVNITPEMIDRMINMPVISIQQSIGRGKRRFQPVKINFRNIL